MANETDWVTDVRRWVQERARVTGDESSAIVASQSMSDGLSDLGYEAADAAVAGRYGVESTLDANRDTR
jgi:hypothetical protein